jgi:hypothetical protein
VDVSVDVSVHPVTDLAQNGPKIDLRGVSPDDGNVAEARSVRQSHGNQAPVVFDRQHAPAPWRKRNRESAQAGSYLNNAVAVARVCGGDDLGEDVLINQKVLPQTLLKTELVFFNNFTHNCRRI